MTLRPCLTCGTPAPGSYCSGCRPADTRPTMRQRGYGTAWDKLSKRLRRASPFCEHCGSVDQLQADHILPAADYPELILVVENCRVLCRTCNAKRGNNFTTDEAQQVIARLQDSYRRHPTRKGRERIAAVENALTSANTMGGCPMPTRAGPHGEAKFQSLIGLLKRPEVPPSVASTHKRRHTDGGDQNHADHASRVMQDFDSWRQDRREGDAARTELCSDLECAADASDSDRFPFEEKLADALAEQEQSDSERQEVIDFDFHNPESFT